MKPLLLATCALLAPAAAAGAQDVYRVRPVRHDSAAAPSALPAATPHIYTVAQSGTADTSAKTSGPAAADSAALKAASKSGAKGPSAVGINVGTVVFSGDIQSWYTAGSSDVINSFKLRRAELKFVGTLSPTAKWTLMIDPAKTLKVSGAGANQSTTPLQDAYITLKAKRFDIQAGQMLIPLTFEGSGFSIATHEAYDRSLMITDGKLGQVRDLGAQLSGNIIEPLKFRLGVFNSTGDTQNASATDNEKAIIGRLELRTPITGLSLGASGAVAGKDTLGRAKHDRIGGDAEYGWNRIGLRGEFMRAWDSTDVRMGAYGLASYRVSDEVQLVGRYDYWDKNGTAAPRGVDVLERDVLGGFSWFIDGSNVQLRANYVWRLFGALPQKDLVVVSLQTAW